MSTPMIRYTSLCIFLVISLAVISGCSQTSETKELEIFKAFR